MLAASKSENVEKPLGTLHPEKIAKMAEMMAQQFRSRTKDLMQLATLLLEENNLLQGIV